MTKSLCFRVVCSDRDEYPGDGLYLRSLDDKSDRLINKEFLTVLGIGVNLGDVVEVSGRVVQRMVPAHLEDVCEETDHDR